MCPSTTCSPIPPLPSLELSPRVKGRWTCLMTSCLAFSADRSLLNYVYDAGSVSSLACSEAGPQEASSGRNLRVLETHPPNTLDLVVIGLDNMLGAWLYILIGGSSQIRSWTSNHPFLTGRPAWTQSCLGSAMSSWQLE